MQISHPHRQGSIRQSSTRARVSVRSSVRQFAQFVQSSINHSVGRSVRPPFPPTTHVWHGHVCKSTVLCTVGNLARVLAPFVPLHVAESRSRAWAGLGGAARNNPRWSRPTDQPPVRLRNPKIGTSGNVLSGRVGEKSSFTAQPTQRYKTENPVCVQVCHLKPKLRVRTGEGMRCQGQRIIQTP